MRLEEISIEDLKPHPHNPRKNLESQELDELTRSIQKRGVLEPLVVTNMNLILCGHRRLAAAKKAGLSTVPCVIRNLKPGEYPEDIFLEENGHRDNLSPLEQARAIQAIKNRYKSDNHGQEMKNTQVARRLSMSTATVSQAMAILKLPEDIQELIHRVEIAGTAAPVLTKLEAEEDHEFRTQMVNSLRARQLTVPVMKKRIAEYLENKNVESSQQKQRKPNNPGAAPFIKPDTVEPFSRDRALEILDANPTGQISMHVIKRVLENECCNCGMMDDPKLCQTCPLPRFVQGLVGRRSQ